MKKFIVTLLGLLFIASGSMAKKKYPMSIMRASYDYDYNFTFSDSENKRKHADMILLIAPEMSRFYSIKTEFLDSLRDTPNGRKIYHQMISDAMAKGHGDIDAIDMPCKDVHTQVTKWFDKGEISVIDFVNMNNYVYTEPIGELQWTIGDSLRTVLGYECQQAFADYHGRRWTAWFAPEIPVTDGPWKLYGLPGLIMEASCEEDEHKFTITGVEKFSQPVTLKPGNPVLEKTDRISFLKEKRASISGSDQELNALLLMGVDGKGSDSYRGATKPSESQQTIIHDFLETDYR